MDSLLADIDIDDPTADPPEDVVMADGVTAAAVEQKVRKEKKDKKDKKEKKEKKRKHDEDTAVDGEKKKKKKKSKAE
jgi:nucleolar protein 56